MKPARDFRVIRTADRLQQLARVHMGRRLLAATFAASLLIAAVPAHAMTCVAYVRAVTGFDLSGNAWQWWNAASGVYNRGHVPEPGAVMVFARTHHMRDGHVAIVREVLGTREILIDQANWEIVHHRRGAVSTAVRVIDASPDNDWTQVRVQWGRGDVFGRVNPVSGFVYPDADSHANVSRARYLEARMRESLENTNPELTPAVARSGVHALHRALCATPTRADDVAQVMASWRVGPVTQVASTARAR